MDALHAYASSSSDDEEDHVPQKMPSSSSAAPVLPLDVVMVQTLRQCRAVVVGSSWR
jgi:hypothetical protein